MRREIVIGIVFMLVIPAISTNKTDSSYFNENGGTLYVGGFGPNNYTKIQDAIDNASNGDTVFVYDDSSPYYENIGIDKSINLLGENRETTVISGNKDEEIVIIIKANHVNISHFTITTSRCVVSTIFVMRLDVVEHHLTLPYRTVNSGIPCVP